MPETRYAKSGDVGIAYQVVGEGELDPVCARARGSSHISCGAARR
jgi:hypothetical protein